MVRARDTLPPPDPTLDWRTDGKRRRAHLAETLGQDVYSIVEAANALAIYPDTVRRAIQKGELKATMMGGRHPLHAGRGMGYRITKDELRRWFFGIEPDPAP